MKTETSTLFDNSDQAPRPLADRLRPQSIAEVVGQDHLLGAEGPIGRMVEQRRLSSMILWGPPGCGTTTIARLLAHASDLYFEPLSAILSGVADLRKVFEAAERRREAGQGTLLFVDEIHRFNRAQQDSFLPYVESGVVTLIGATTENPSFELNGALLSRCQVFVLNRLDEAALGLLLDRAGDLPITDDSRSLLINMADGDGRYLLNLAEILVSVIKSGEKVEPDKLKEILNKRAPLYDKAQEGHYNLISALHKSLRGSDAQAALYWFSRMMAGGEDPRYVMRRMIRFASEDIGLADPQALVQTLAAADAYERLGSPEGELCIVQALIYLATAPKSNAAYMAMKEAKVAALRTGSLMPPKHILNAPTKLMAEVGYGDGYVYDPDTADGFSGQDYFPEAMGRTEFYRPKERGFEREIIKRLDYWAKLREQKNGK